MVGLAAIEHVAQIGCRNSPSLPARATSSGSAAVDAMFGAGRALSVMVISATLDPPPTVLPAAVVVRSLNSDLSTLWCRGACLLVSLHRQPIYTARISFDVALSRCHAVARAR